MAEDFTSLMIGALQHAYSAETQLLEALPQMAESAHSPTLRQAFEEHLAETRGHVERLERAAEMLDADPEGEECEAMEGLVAAAEDIMDDHEEGPVRDAALVGAAQKVEHHEIAAYGTLCAMAKAAGMPEVADLLGQTLAEAKAADERLTRLAEREIHPAALRGPTD